MNDLIFIRDVIYGLKQEYGSEGYIVRQTEVIDLSTGVKTPTDVFRVFVPKMVLLPFSWRKKFGVQSKGGIEYVGSQEILVDKSDLPAGITLETGDFINAKGQRVDIGEVNNFEFAFLLQSKSLRAMPYG
jgi:hypothetical protein